MFIVPGKSVNFLVPEAIKARPSSTYRIQAMMLRAEADMVVGAE